MSMYEYQTHHEFAPHGWVKHHLPWLAIFAFVFGLIKDGDDGEASDSDAFFG
jgi:hypothetical protein